MIPFGTPFFWEKERQRDSWVVIFALDGSCLAVRTHYQLRIDCPIFMDERLAHCSQPQRFRTIALGFCHGSIGTTDTRPQFWPDSRVSEHLARLYISS